MAAAQVHISIILHKGTPLDYPQYRHTALWLQSSDGSPARLAEIAGAHGFFEYEHADHADPSLNQDCVRLIDVGDLSRLSTRVSIVQALSRVLVDHDDREYDC
ncbi:hypothetical protein B0A48_01982 [Cryoendolithus antarcticus]|uniref:Uncharacterized protein n=1 Tax=Cryoendolithus antarcticus TaxID=1507870 RepID=A0A1V8TRA5_9PEZI|nr:hypothetical protein B0A48_01982 [Cryoendolithus antarcticus]